MEEETIGIAVSRRTKPQKNVLIDVEKVSKIVQVGIEYERERIIGLASEIRSVAIKHAMRGGPINFEKADAAIVELIKGENK